MSVQVLEQESATVDEQGVGPPALGTAGPGGGRAPWILCSRHLHVGTAALNVVWAEQVVPIEGKCRLVLAGGDLLKYVLVSVGSRTGFGWQGESRPVVRPGLTLGCKASTSADIERDRELGVDQAEKAYLHLASIARDEVFEDGVLNSLSNGIPGFLLRFGPDGIEAIERLWDCKRLDGEVLAETLLWLGRVDSPATLGGRLGLLLKGLRDRSPRVRDAGALGLASLGDGRAAEYVRQAREQESIPELRAFLDELLQELGS